MRAAFLHRRRAAQARVPEPLRRLLAALADLWRGLFGFQRGREGAGSHAARLEEHYRKPRRCC